MSRDWGAKMGGPLAVYASRFAEELGELGYSKSAAKRQMQLTAQLSRWLETEGLSVLELTANLAEPLFVTRRNEGRSNLVTTRSLKPLIGFLRRAGLPEPSKPESIDPTDLMVSRFCLYLVRERGLASGTVHFYAHVARLFISERSGEDQVNLTGMTATDVMEFTGRVCKGRGLSSSRQVVSALRSFLRWLQLEGITELPLDQAVWSAAGWDSSLPRAVDAGKAARLLASCDRRRSIERRDYAVLILLIRLGLRGGELVRLELDDVDWRSGEILVHGKGRREDRLPLPADVGEALAGYLRRGRPRSDSRRIFLRHHAPFVGWSDTGAVRGILERACGRAGIAYVSPHRLRHTAATEMLRAGAPLSEIAQVLRHRSITTTSHYAKVDHARLSKLAQSWPVGAP